MPAAPAGTEEIQLTDHDIAEFIARPASAPRPRWKEYARKQRKLLGYRVVHWYQAEGFKRRLVTLGVFLYLPIVSAIKLGLSWHTALAVAALMGIGVRRAYQEMSPGHMQIVQHNYLGRKLRMTRLLEEMWQADRMTPEQIQRFKEDVLVLIAGYVRAHRFDLKGTKIFANLLVQDGNEMVVIARNERHRVLGARYPKDDMLAGKVMDTGEVQASGSVHRDFPWCMMSSKPYKSVLALPIWFESRLVGVVTIDSQLEYHFDGEAETLYHYLSPYLAVLGWTLSERRGIATVEPQQA